MIQSMKCFSLKLVREASIPYEGRLTAPQAVVDFGKSYLADKDREHALILALNTPHEIIGVNVAAVGTLDSALVHPREVFKFAILSNAAEIVFIHNHPSGNVEPSAEDIALVERLKNAGVLMGISVLDAIIIGGENFYSFRDKGRL